MDQNSVVAYITDYDVAQGHNPWGLAESVTKLLKKGYIVYGQPFADKDGLLMQAMVKIDDRLNTVLNNALDQMTKAV